MLPGKPWRFETEVWHWTLQKQTTAKSSKKRLWRSFPVWEREPWLQSPRNQTQSARQCRQGANDGRGKKGFFCRMSQKVISIWNSNCFKTNNNNWIMGHCLLVSLCLDLNLDVLYNIWRCVPLWSLSFLSKLGTDVHVPDKYLVVTFHVLCTCILHPDVLDCIRGFFTQPALTAHI